MGEPLHLSHLSCTFSMENQSNFPWKTKRKMNHLSTCAFFLVAMFKILVKTWRNLRASATKIVTFIQVYVANQLDPISIMLFNIIQLYSSQ